VKFSTGKTREQVCLCARKTGSPWAKRDTRRQLQDDPRHGGNLTGGAANDIATWGAGDPGGVGWVARTAGEGRGRRGGVSRASAQSMPRAPREDPGSSMLSPDLSFRGPLGPPPIVPFMVPRAKGEALPPGSTAPWYTAPGYTAPAPRGVSPALAGAAGEAGVESCAEAVAESGAEASAEISAEAGAEVGNWARDGAGAGAGAGAGREGVGAGSGGRAPGG